MASYARTIRAADGTEIAYVVEGTGPALVLTNGLTTTSHFWKYLRPRWVERYTVVTWDLPGHGGSAPACTHHSARIESQPAILARVMDDLGIARATHVGWSIGCQIVLELYRQFPERCDALIALFGPAAHALSCTRMPFLSGARIYELLNHPLGGSKFAALVQRVAQLGALPHGPALVKRLGLIGRGTSDADLRQLIADLRRVDTVSGKLLACSAERHSAFDVLPKVRVPLLIVAGDKDLFAPAEVVGVPMHRAAPGSVLMRFEDATHSALLDHHEQLAIVIDDFLHTRSARPANARRSS